MGIRRRDIYFDFGIAQSWLEHCCFCHDEHGCCRKPEGTLFSFCVLDCETKKVITAPRDCFYVALSYVWGTQTQGHNASPAEPQSVMQDSNSVLHFQFDYENAPRVVKDAVEVALKLRIPYLWVDRYCIDQADSLQKDAQIRQMDMIYRNAHFTIVAAAGEDANRGLPGTSGTPRTPIPSIKIRHQILQTVALGPERILGSKWASRGWTFQEALLSTRHIIFTEHEVFFQCAGMRCSESLQIPLDLLHHHKIIESDRSSLSVAVTPRIGSNPSTFHTYISDFSKRTLSRETDTLNALQGIFRRFEKECQLYTYYGIPFHPRATETRRGVRTLQGGFLYGLLWTRTKPGSRVLGFPSWSWAGWNGGYVCKDWPPSTRFNSLNDELKKWDTKTNEIHLLGATDEQKLVIPTRPHGLPQLCSSPQRGSGLIYLSGLSFNFTCKEAAFSYPHTALDHMKYLAHIVLDDDTVVAIGVSFCLKFESSGRYYLDPLTHNFTAVMIGNGFALVLLKADVYYERIGALCLDHSESLQSLVPSPGDGRWVSRIRAEVKGFYIR